MPYVRFIFTGCGYCAFDQDDVISPGGGDDTPKGKTGIEGDIYILPAVDTSSPTAPQDDNFLIVILNV